MSASNKGDPDLAMLRDDITALKRDVTSLMEHLRAGVTGSAQSAAAQVDEGAHRLCHNLAAEAERRAKALGRQVEEQPLTALLIALGVGYIGGRFLSR
jgi:ElaB/YqjD/DUF883 family membrane-anchored ribosome-binding protein